MHLDEIQSPDDLRALSQPELEELAAEIRQRIIGTVSQNGGHLSSNLGGSLTWAIRATRISCSPAG